MENIDAVYEELLRLKNEGVDRIFINSDTTELLSKLSSFRTSNKAIKNAVNEDRNLTKSHTDPSTTKFTKKKESFKNWFCDFQSLKFSIFDFSIFELLNF